MNRFTMVFSDTSFQRNSQDIYIYIYINQAITLRFKHFFRFIKGDFRWYFVAINQLFNCHQFSIKKGIKRRSSFFIDIFWLGKNKFDEVGLLQMRSGRYNEKDNSHYQFLSLTLNQRI
jgi:hypothetical protein